MADRLFHHLTRPLDSQKLNANSRHGTVIAIALSYLQGLSCHPLHRRHPHL
jgi:hypothetical protein